MNATAHGPSDLLEEVVIRLAAMPGFMANVLARIIPGPVTVQRIAAELGCAADEAIRVGMMRAPRPDHFKSDVERIAQAAGVDQVRLKSLIRQSQALEEFGTDVDDAGLLMAARDLIPRDPTG